MTHEEKTKKQHTVIDYQQATECLFEFFKENQWLLLNSKLTVHPQPEIEQEAVRFLLALSQKKINDWNGANQAVQETVTLLLMDFFTKLSQNPSPFSHHTWKVRKSASLAEKALEIIAFEIQQSHRQLAKPH